jgi:Tol biopolymer transport system component
LALLIIVMSAGAMPSRLAAFSPDGTRALVVWPSAGAGGFDLGVVDIAGGTVTRLGRSVSQELQAMWSPDGNWIVYPATEGDRSVSWIYEVRTGTSRPLSRNFGPPYAWREDSRRLAGVAQDERTGLSVVFFSVSERGETLRVPVPVSEVRSLCWLPDTDDVAFMGLADGRRDVYAIESGQMRRLSTSGDVIALQLTAGTNELVWARPSKNTRYILLSLYALNLTSRSVRRLPFPDRIAAINPAPAQSPDAVADVAIAPTGDRIAVVVSDTPTRSSGIRETVRRDRLFSVRTDGTDAKLIRTLFMPEGASGSRLAPCWSSDGKLLGVVHYEAGSAAFAVFSADGSNGRVVVRSTAVRQ